MIRTLPAALLILLPLVAWSADTPLGQEVEVQLVSGDVIRGTLVEHTAEQVLIKTTVTLKGSSMTSTRTIPAAQVRAVLTLADEYKLRVKNTATTGPDQAALARWCQEHGMLAETRLHAEKALALEPVNANAKEVMQQLGLVNLDGDWKDVDTLLKTTGLVRYDGTVTDAPTRDRLKVLMGKKLTDNAALIEAKAKSDNLTASLATAKERIVAAEKNAADSGNLAAEAEAKKKALDGAKAADLAAAERIKTSSNPIVTKHSNGSSSTTTNPDLVNAEAAKSKTAAALVTAQRAMNGVSPATAKARKAKLDQDAAKAKEDIARLTKDLPLAQQAIPAKQTAAEASAKAYAEARDAITLPADLAPAIRDFLAAEKK